MATYSLSPLFNGWQGYNAAGQPLNLGTITVYLAGTTTLTTTWTTSSAGTANSNPITLTNGFPPDQIWLQDGVPVKFVVKDAAGSTLSTDDNIQSMNYVLALLAASSGSSLVGFIQAGTGATLRTEQDKDRDAFSTKDFGAVGDGSTDDTTAVQKTITAALAAGRGVCVDGLSYITASLTIDRLVDNQTNVFRIFAKGTGQGFKVNDGVTLFDTTLTYTTFPVSDYIRFDGVHFEEKTPATATSYVINEKFLRITFEKCHFEAIKCVDASATTAYLQSWKFKDCTYQHWKGWFVNTAGCFDVSFSGGVTESGESFFQSYDTSGSRATYGLRYTDNLAESNTGTVLSIDGSRGVTIAANYFEGNGTVAAPTIDLSVGTLQESGLAVIGNFFGNHAAPNAAAYNIKWGQVKEGVSFGNFALTNLHDNSGAPATFNLSSANDQANTTLWSTPRGNGLAALTFNQATAASGSGVFAIDSSKYNFFQLVVGNATTAGIGTPTNAVFGQEFTVQLWNNVGANITAFSYTAIYKPPTWTNLAANTTRTLKFWYDGTNWRVTGLLDAPT